MEKINQLINKDMKESLQQLDTLAETVAHFFSIRAENRLWPVLRNQRLTLITDDPHLATQARFQQNPLCKYLSKCLNTKIRGVDIKVISLPVASFEQKTNGFRLSQDTAQIMHSIAQGIEDKELQEAVMLLTETARKPPPRRY
jgi:hypothetical protein